MARWIKFYEETFDAQDLCNPNVFIVWMWLLSNAAYKSVPISWAGKRRDLEPGQVYFKTSELAGKFQLSHKQVRIVLEKLKIRESLSYESGKMGVIVTICNWLEYQDTENSKGHNKGTIKATRGQDEGKIGARYGISPILKRKKDRKKEYITKNIFAESSDELLHDQVHPTPLPENDFLTCEVIKPDVLDKIEVLPDPKPPQKHKKESRSCKAWEGYKRAYQERYKVAPERGKMFNNWLCKFCDEVPQEHHDDVAYFYVKHNDAWFVRNGHDPKWLALNAQRLYTEWRTGNKITGQAAKQTELADANMEALKRVLERDEK